MKANSKLTMAKTDASKVTNIGSTSNRVKEGWGEVFEKQNSLGFSSIPEKV